LQKLICKQERKESVMSIIHTGLDVHDDTIRVYACDPDTGSALIDQTIINSEPSVRKHFKKWSTKYELRCCYEASGCGYVLYRWLSALDVECAVVAPSLVPRKPGDQVKTDRRDAIKLAQCHRRGDLTLVRIPTVQEEQDRRVVRHREVVVRRVVRTKNQIQKLLVSLGIKNPFRSSWTDQHLAWVKGLVLPDGDSFVLSELLEMLTFEMARLSAIDKRVLEMAQSELYSSRVSMLRCLRGIEYVSAMVLVTEIVDFSRFPTPRHLMSFLGLTPSESSSGKSRRLGGITKSGNTRCRHIVVEAAGRYRNKPRISDPIKKRQLGQDPAVIAHSWKAQERLHKKYWGIANRNKQKGKATVAVARELVGFIWAIMTGSFTQVQKKQPTGSTKKVPVQGAKLLEVMQVRQALEVLSAADPRVVELAREKQRLTLA
jgi:transposase